MNTLPAIHINNPNNTDHLSLQHENLAELIEHAMHKHPSNSAYQCLGQTLSFEEMNQKSAALANYLLEVVQLKSGDRVAIQLPNLLQYPIAAFAILRAGLVLVNTNPLYTTREMHHQFADSGAKAIIILTDLLPKLESIVHATDIKTIITCQAIDLIVTQMNTRQAPSIKPGTQEQLEVRKITLLDAIDHGSTVNQGDSYPKVHRKKIYLDDIALIQYTGGTTGLSKGAILSHKNILANIEQTNQRLNDVTEVATELFITPLPLYHVYAFLLNLWVFSKCNNNILIADPRDLTGFIDLLSCVKPTGFCGINTLFIGLCHHPKISNVDFSQLKLTVSGGAALTTDASEKWQNLTHCSISEGYGLSETSPVVCLNPPGEEQLGSIGLPLIHTQVQIWNENEQEVALGDSGEIVVKGPQVMQGYWQQPEETEQVLNQEGWLKTGDIAIKQADGYFRIVDRKKDMIIVSGFNVYPNEVENILMSHPDVIEAAVVGQSSDKTGELVAAYIVKSNKVNLSQQEIINYCQTILTPYKIPKKVVFLDELPKSAIGKVLRRELRH